MIARPVSLLTFVLVVLLTTSCAGSLFKVKPVVELPPLAGDVKTVNAGGVTVRAAPLMSDEQSQELFEANLPLGGILPVRLELVFDSGVAVETKKLRFHLRDGEGREWKLLSPKTAVGHILKANDVYAYNPSSRKQFEKEFLAYGLDLSSPLSDSDRQRQGFVFFETPKKEPVATPRGLVLTVQGLTQPLEVKISE
jgi:hypothetical protein